MSLIFPGWCGLPSSNEWLGRHKINDDEALVAVLWEFGRGRMVSSWMSAIILTKLSKTLVATGRLTSEVFLAISRVFMPSNLRVMYIYVHQKLYSYVPRLHVPRHSRYNFPQL